MDSDPTPDDAPDGAPAEAPAAMSREEQRFAMMRDLEALVERYQEEFDFDIADVVFCLKCTEHVIMREATFCYIGTLALDDEEDGGGYEDGEDNEGGRGVAQSVSPAAVHRNIARLDSALRQAPELREACGEKHAKAWSTLTNHLLDLRSSLMAERDGDKKGTKET